MTKPFGVRELIILKSIAETIYLAKDPVTTLNAALRDIVDLTDMQTGWIFLVDQGSNYTCPAAYRLPGALSREERKALIAGSCWCLDEYAGGKLRSAVTVPCCQRLERAPDHRYGDQAGITHHVAVPLTTGTRLFGILNVAAAGKDRYTEEDLLLMESIAFRIAISLERNDMYRSEQKRADLYARLGELTRKLNKLQITEQIPEMVTRWMGECVGFECTAFFMEENGKLSQRVSWKNGSLDLRRKLYTFTQAGQIGEALRQGETKVTRDLLHEHEGDPHTSHSVRSSAAVPLWFRGKPIGVLYANHAEGRVCSRVEVEVIEALAGHVALAFENARLYQQQMDVLKWEERNRLARDLHDSVSQRLFSLQYTARGLEVMLDHPPEMVQRAIKDMQDLTQNALSEMRSLIMQLRPVGIEQGLLTGLRAYGKAQGLTVHTSAEKMLVLSCLVEETLFRIGQEALNNASKHAGDPHVHIQLKKQEDQVIMEIIDRGVGFSPFDQEGTGNFGMRTMRERAGTLGGTIEIESGAGEGTTVRVSIPCRS